MPNGMVTSLAPTNYSVMGQHLAAFLGLAEQTMRNWRTISANGGVGTTARLTKRQKKNTKQMVGGGGRWGVWG